MATYDADAINWADAGGLTPLHWALTQQRYEAAANRCVAPDCATRYFQTLNAETQRCELSAGFDTLSAVVLAFLASLELYLQRMQVTVSGRARRE